MYKYLTLPRGLSGHVPYKLPPSKVQTNPVHLNLQRGKLTILIHAAIPDMQFQQTGDFGTMLG